MKRPRSQNPHVAGSQAKPEALGHQHDTRHHPATAVTILPGQAHKAQIGPARPRSSLPSVASRERMQTAPAAGRQHRRRTGPAPPHLDSNTTSSASPPVWSLLLCAWRKHQGTLSLPPPPAFDSRAPPPPPASAVALARGTGLRWCCFLGLGVSGVALARERPGRE
jgi:hypothetical protein